MKLSMVVSVYVEYLLFASFNSLTKHMLVRVLKLLRWKLICFHFELAVSFANEGKHSLK